MAAILFKPQCVNLVIVPAGGLVLSDIKESASSIDHVWTVCKDLGTKSRYFRHE